MHSIPWGATVRQLMSRKPSCSLLQNRPRGSLERYCPSMEVLQRADNSGRKRASRPGRRAACAETISFKALNEAQENPIPLLMPLPSRATRFLSRQRGQSSVWKPFRNIIQTVPVVAPGDWKIRVAGRLRKTASDRYRYTLRCTHRTERLRLGSECRLKHSPDHRRNDRSSCHRSSRL